MKPDSLIIPFIPDYVHAYKIGKCNQCKEEMEKDSNFNNRQCPHCKKLTKEYVWTSKKQS